MWMEPLFISVLPLEIREDRPQTNVQHVQLAVFGRHFLKKKNIALSCIVTWPVQHAVETDIDGGMAGV